MSCRCMVVVHGAVGEAAGVMCMATLSPTVMKDDLVTAVDVVYLLWNRAGPHRTSDDPYPRNYRTTGRQRATGHVISR